MHHTLRHLLKFVFYLLSSCTIFSVCNTGSVVVDIQILLTVQSILPYMVYHGVTNPHFFHRHLFFITIYTRTATFEYKMVVNNFHI